MQIQQSIVTEKILLALCSILRHSFRFIWRFCVNDVVSHTFLSILVWLIVAIRHNRTRYGWQRTCTESVLLAHHLWLCISAAWVTFMTVLGKPFFVYYAQYIFSQWSHYTMLEITFLCEYLSMAEKRWSLYWSSKLPCVSKLLVVIAFVLLR